MAEESWIAKFAVSILRSRTSEAKICGFTFLHSWIFKVRTLYKLVRMSYISVWWIASLCLLSSSCSSPVVDYLGFKNGDHDNSLLLEFCQWWTLFRNHRKFRNGVVNSVVNSETALGNSSKDFRDEILVAPEELEQFQCRGWRPTQSLRLLGGLCV